MLTLYMRHPWRIKLKKHPVFFTHFHIPLTEFSVKIKPIVPFATLHHYDFFSKLGLKHQNFF